MNVPIDQIAMIGNLEIAKDVSIDFHFFFVTSSKKMPSKFFLRPKKERFFDKNGQKQCFLTNINIFCFNFVISML